MDMQADKERRDIVVIGASAGGVEALTRLCAGLPADFPASLFVVQHLSPTGPSVLPKLLSRAGPLPVSSARDGAAVERGRVYVAVPDRHLLLRDGRMLLRRGPQENRTRPSIDALFRSAAIAYGSRVIGVVLTGLLDDGTDGLIAIKQAGGLSMVQDPADAMWPSMPREALARDHVDHCVPLAQMPELLKRLVRERAGKSQPLPEDILTEDRIAGQEVSAVIRHLGTAGMPSVMSCPQCGGVLNEIADTSPVRFRCQIGHAFTMAGLSLAQGSEVERGLAVAIRTHRERMALFQRMHEDAGKRGLQHSAERWQRAAREAEQLSQALERALELVGRAVEMHAEE